MTQKLTNILLITIFVIYTIIFTAFAFPEIVAVVLGYW